MNDFCLHDEFIIRTPRYPFLDLENLINQDIMELKENDEILESIYIASIDLYNALKRFDSLNEKEVNRVRNSIVRYLTRMTARSTPFGLFAGICVAERGERTEIVISENIEKFADIDMECLFLIYRSLIRLPEIRNSILFFPNNTLYKRGKEWCYLEYIWNDEDFFYQISSIPVTTTLNSIIGFAREGRNIRDITMLLMEQGVDSEAANNFIDELLNAQILIPEIYPNITGEGYLKRISSLLKKKQVALEPIFLIDRILANLDLISSNFQPAIEVYDKIKKDCISLSNSARKINFIKVDMGRKAQISQIGKSISNEIMSVFSFLCKISRMQTNPNLNEFKKQFLDRYGDAEMPLPIVLDPEIGLGYPATSYDSIGKDDLIKDIILSKRAKERVGLSSFQKIILNKITEGQGEIAVEDLNIKYAENSDTDVTKYLPCSFSVFFSILKDDAQGLRLYLKSIGGNSAASLLSRFSHFDYIDRCVRDIAEKEECLLGLPNAILAEIIHLPTPHIGNVIQYPHIRKYEIAYAAMSTKSSEEVIRIDDIVVSIKNNRIQLKSKSKNRIVLPILTNAYNFSRSPVMLYRFLCDLQYQGGQSTLSFDLGLLEQFLPHIPRIRYRNTILFPESWNVDMSNSILNDNSKRISQCHRALEFKSNMNLPRYTMLRDGDNELLIDWENEHSRQSFMHAVQGRTRFTLREFLYIEEDAVVVNKNGKGYLNECIASIIRK